VRIAPTSPWASWPRLTAAKPVAFTGQDWRETANRARWEYACRAETTGMTWLGDIEIRGANDAPRYHPVARRGLLPVAPCSRFW